MKHARAGALGSVLVGGLVLVLVLGLVGYALGWFDGKKTEEKGALEALIDATVAAAEEVAGAGAAAVDTDGDESWTDWFTYSPGAVAWDYYFGE